MKQCTLFCRRDDPGGVLALATEHLRTPATTEGSPEDWSAALFERSVGTVRVSRLPRRTPGDRPAKIVMGLVNWLERTGTRHPTATPVAVARLFKTTSILGLTGTPELSEAAGDFDFVFALAELADALIWNGSALLTPEGDVLIDEDGRTEITRTEA